MFIRIYGGAVTSGNLFVRVQAILAQRSILLAEGFTFSSLGHTSNLVTLARLIEASGYVPSNKNHLGPYRFGSTIDKMQ